MRINRALALRDECRDNLNGLFSHARAFGLSHAAMLDKRAEIHAKCAKCPAWVRAYLSGVWDTMTAELYRADLIYGAWIDGRFHSTHSNREDYYEKLGMNASEFATRVQAGLETGHFWKERLDRPFFISKN